MAVKFHEGDKVKGYKGMKADMTCRGMQYEVGKTYYAEGEIGLCENGLHFCKSLRNVVQFYPNDYGNRFFEVEAEGDIVSDGCKSAASKLTIGRELSPREVGRGVYMNDSDNIVRDYSDNTICYERVFHDSAIGYGNGGVYGYDSYGNFYQWGNTIYGNTIYEVLRFLD